MPNTAWLQKPLEDFAEDISNLSDIVPASVPGHTADLHALHEVFHEQSKYHRATAAGIVGNIRDHMENPVLVEQSVMGHHKPAGLPVTALPEPGDLDQSLSAVLGARVSARRENLTGTIPLNTISDLLGHSARAGRTGVPKSAPHLVQHFRPYPSAGALYPCEVYLISAGVDGLAAGIYRYDAIGHALVHISNQDGAAFAGAETRRDHETPVPCAIAVTGVFERSVRKYGLRGYRFALLEAGHLLQNLSLVATALGLNALVSASFYEAELEAVLGIDGVSEAVLASFLIGAREE